MCRAGPCHACTHVKFAKEKKCLISVLKANSTKNACFVFWRVTICAESKCDQSCVMAI